MIIDPTVIAIPVYFLLIGIELIVHRVQAVKSYRLNDAITNINCGVTSQVTGAFLKVLSIGVYTLIFEKFRIIELQNTALVWIMAFIAYDFFYYWAHRMSHQVNLFWGGHSVHHQSEEYNLSVALRQSSTQTVWTFAFYIPMAIVGVHPILLVSVSGFNLLYQFWIHTESINKLPRWFEAIFNTPSHHRVHHARNPKYIDKNHAGTFIVWDKLFGTFKAEEERPVYGITKNLNSWNPIWANIAHYSDMWSDVKTIPKWSDKFRYVFEKPGWLPDYMGGYRAPEEVDLIKYRKFDTHTAAKLNVYVLVQYIILLAGTAMFLFNLDKMGTSDKLIFAGVIIYSVVSFGALFENRNWGFAMESLRLIFLALTTFYAFFGLNPDPIMITVAAAILIMFQIWLMLVRKVPLPAKAQLK
ncbi:sterol desaturase [Roseivirga seohaensis subsp. aquiponti]|uniref:Sterol desaturase n=1 Tax=Roseivirga seohaensis subsp. aquiponti TaxID=1566026 RepID=A0A0L8AMJ2_9BACT|nr:sterol desaturase family protein [Roseivirga seohaensis]KOF03683.1 sterol desaturase [Roseivirga seohaensis subsp. aquiponti]